METPDLPAIRALRPAWNKGRIVGQKRPFKPKHVWAIRVRLELAGNHRDLALFNMAIDSKLRGCDLMKMKVVDVMAPGQIKERASVLQSKTQKPVRFGISEGTRASVEKWMEDELMVGSEYLWPGRFHDRLHISTRRYARIVRDRVTSIGLEASAYGTHSMRRTKVTQIYEKTGNLRAVQLLPGHTRMDSSVRYLGVEPEDAIAIAEAIEIQQLRVAFTGGPNWTLALPDNAAVKLSYCGHSCMLQHSAGLNVGQRMKRNLAALAPTAAISVQELILLI